ncbi:MAG: RES family NAD+ phosphorylase [Legionella sp.]|nr:RES family NAD+ phosphorylase [Legionella sp.]
MHLFEVISDYENDVFRNIPSIKPAQDLFYDLSHDKKDWAAANILETETHSLVENNQLIQRGFEYSENLFIDYPFENLTVSRFGDGSIPCWYASETLQTTIYETTYHFVQGVNDSIDAFMDEKIVKADRRVAKTACMGLAIDLSTKTEEFPWLVDSTHYSSCQEVGKKIAKEGHPLLRVKSARYSKGINVVAFNSSVLSNVRDYCFLSYSLNLENMEVTVSRGKKMVMRIKFS